MKVIKDSIKEKSEIFNLRLTKIERQQIKDKADSYFNGNMSGYMKYAAINFKPKNEDLIDVKN
jgi:hypothetical protein